MMESNILCFEVKIKNFLAKLLEPSYELKCEKQLDRFLKYLSATHDTEAESTLIDLPVFIQWILQAVTQWTVEKTTPSVQIGSFTLTVASFLSKNEFYFCAVNNNNFYVKLVNVFKARQQTAPAVIKLSYIKLMSSFLEHKSGIELMVASNFWEDILEFSLKSKHLVVVKDSWKFMCKILEKTIDSETDFCSTVVKNIMLPLDENTCNATKAAKNKHTEEYVFVKLRPTLQLVGHILEYFLEQCFTSEKDFRVAMLFLENFHLEQRMSDFMLIARNRYLEFELAKIILIMQFLELKSNLDSGRTSLEKVQEMFTQVSDIFHSNLSKGNFETVMKFSCFGMFYWKLIIQEIPVLPDNPVQNPKFFSEQFFMINFLPMFWFFFKYCMDMSMVKADEDTFRESFVIEVSKMFDERTVRLTYFWKNETFDSRVDIFDLCPKAVVSILKSRKHISRNMSVIGLQCFIYFLKNTVNTLKEAPQKFELFVQHQTFFAMHLDALYIFIDEYKVTWRDSVESVDVMDVCFDFLSIPNWPTVLIVKMLRLLNISLINYMSPNLALLVDAIGDSTIALLGPLLYVKMLDETREIRNAAMEIVRSMSELSTSKFPSLQKVLMDSDLPGLVVKMATQDGESFVRATAIKCLQEMIQVEEIWNNALQSQDLSEKMRQILINETEGIVRVEAATFMCISYENNHFPDDSLEKVYETMIHSSTTDLHWEVKVRALSFWDKVIHNHLQHQGMIDGSFPSVTFSKEHRKIVTLTDAEIKKRLQKILGQLSCIGCLGVLISAIRDDCDMEVSKTAVKITQKLVELLKKYSINADSTVPISPQPTENGMSSSASISSGISGDDFMGSPATNANTELNEEIIDQIVNSRDVNLLQNVYTPSDYGSVLNYDVQVRKIVSPNEFLLFTQQDLNAIINEKKNWLNGIEDLGSLLDDMLKTYDDDVNSMDCY